MMARQGGPPAWALESPLWALKDPAFIFSLASNGLWALGSLGSIMAPLQGGRLLWAPWVLMGPGHLALLGSNGRLWAPWALIGLGLSWVLMDSGLLGSPGP